MVKEYRKGKFTAFFGSSVNIFGVGFTVSRWNIDLTLGFFWLSIEW
jgi:hypothetical protein